MHLFGSSRNGFGARGSDVDLGLLVPEPPVPTKTEATPLPVEEPTTSPISVSAPPSFDEKEASAATEDASLGDAAVYSEEETGNEPDARDVDSAELFSLQGLHGLLDELTIAPEPKPAPGPSAKAHTVLHATPKASFRCPVCGSKHGRWKAMLQHLTTKGCLPESMSHNAMRRECEVSSVSQFKRHTVVCHVLPLGCLARITLTLIYLHTPPFPAALPVIVCRCSAVAMTATLQVVTSKHGPDVSVPRQDSPMSGQKPRPGKAEYQMAGQVGSKVDAEGEGEGEIDNPRQEIAEPVNFRCPTCHVGFARWLHMDTHLQSTQHIRGHHSTWKRKCKVRIAHSRPSSNLLLACKHLCKNMCPCTQGTVCHLASWLFYTAIPTCCQPHMHPTSPKAMHTYTQP